MKYSALAISLISLFTLVGCGEQPSQTADAGASVSVQDVAWLLETEPAGAVSVSEVKASATEGQTVVVRGRIGGRKEPISDGSPVFTIVDLSLPHCGEIPGDKCKTPWDYCCETPEDLTANSVTIMLASVDPRVGGLKELDEIVVEGAVGPRPNESVLTVIATGVFVVK
ncbi:MAG: hypothetical protein ED559_08840 [Phycisphaera sp.]|nr:MAG: hypothetical protein ED559_08840 [Phycisphaera sp.]